MRGVYERSANLWLLQKCPSVATCLNSFGEFTFRGLYQCFEDCFLLRERNKVSSREIVTGRNPKTGCRETLTFLTREI